MGLLDIVVVGAHMSGLALNDELVRLGGSFARAVRTTADYRFYALAGSTPERPGLLRVTDGSGGSIAAEIWRLPVQGFGSFVAAVPAPLSIGTIRLDDGQSAKGFLVEAAGIPGSRDITDLGGWRAYLAGLAPAN